MSFLLVSAFLTFSNSQCNFDTTLTDTCGTIRVSDVDNWDMDGTYERLDDGLYQKTSGSDRYISYWAQGDYVGNSVGDRRCKSQSLSYYLRFATSDVNSITVGSEEDFWAEYPNTRVTIECLTGWGTTEQPTRKPTDKPSISPSKEPTVTPTNIPTSIPTNVPTAIPSSNPSENPTESPSQNPSKQPSVTPTETPTIFPTGQPSLFPTMEPTIEPSYAPSMTPIIGILCSLIYNLSVWTLKALLSTSLFVYY